MSEMIVHYSTIRKLFASSSPKYHLTAKAVVGGGLLFLFSSFNTNKRMFISIFTTSFEYFF